MQGSWNHDQAYYRCRYPSEYALPRGAQHPPTVYVRESQVIPSLDDWIAGIFEPDRLEDTCSRLAAAGESASAEAGREEAARRTLADCAERLAREALEAGTDPALVARWISEVQAERKVAEEELRRRRPAAALTEDDIRAMVENVGDLVDVLEAAEPATKAALYEGLGLALTYEPSERRVLVEADLSGVRPVRVGGATPDHYGRSQLRRGAETPPIMRRLKHALSPCLGSRSGR
jgi:hypothetical protein